MFNENIADIDTLHHSKLGDVLIAQDTHFCCIIEWLVLLNNFKHDGPSQGEDSPEGTRILAQDYQLLFLVLKFNLLNQTQGHLRAFRRQRTLKSLHNQMPTMPTNQITVLPKFMKLAVLDNYSQEVL